MHLCIFQIGIHLRRFIEKPRLDELYCEGKWGLELAHCF